jgi:hypothetical protein
MDRLLGLARCQLEATIERQHAPVLDGLFQDVPEIEAMHLEADRVRFGAGDE